MNLFWMLCLKFQIVKNAEYFLNQKNTTIFLVNFIFLQLGHLWPRWVVLELIWWKENTTDVIKWWFWAAWNVSKKSDIDLCSFKTFSLIWIRISLQSKVIHLIIPIEPTQKCQNIAGYHFIMEDYSILFYVS
jgi:hypothetical protein